PAYLHEENDMARTSKETGSHMLDEADIGSGEKRPADHETEEEISKIRDQSGRVSADEADANEAGRDGTGKGLLQDEAFPPKGN
ncbi:MAG TPA: hypothetical protein VN019_00315, partial [Oxalicibacterium sp.]|nr:hypothetical protein [Oxalicibacterium sp.]